MANKIVKLESGATLEIQLADFEKANRLLKAFAKEVEQVKISMGMTQMAANDIMKLKNLSEETINTLKNFVARMIASEAIEEAMWPCMSTVLYNGQKVSRDTFRDEEARKDYLVIFREVMMANLLPFGSGLFSMLKAQPANIAGSQA